MKNIWIFVVGLLLLSSVQRTLASSYATLNLDNDFWLETDYYYTHGVYASYFDSGLYGTFLKHIALYKPEQSSYKDNNACGITFQQRLYTPENIRNLAAQVGNRPYAATMTANFAVIQNRYLFGDIWKWELSLGVIGPAAKGRQTQAEIHSWNSNVHNNPVGWENQISNDIIANYSLSLEHSLLRNNISKLSLENQISLGTFDISAGLFMRGYLGDYAYYNEDKFATATKKTGGFGNLHAYLFADAGIKTKLYDATLLGGMFSNSAYTIPYSEMAYILIKSNAGFALGYKRFNLFTAWHLVSPEFKNSKWHSYIGIDLSWRIS